MRLEQREYTLYYFLSWGLFLFLSVVGLPLVNIISVIIVHFWIGVRRFHDIGKSGWWALVTLLPFVSFILIFIKGQEGSNQYGEDPRVKN